MINRTPTTGMQSRANQQAGRAGGVHYGRNPHMGGAGAQARQNMGQPRAASEAPENAARSKQQNEQPGEQNQNIQSPNSGANLEPAALTDGAAPEALKNPLFLPGYLRTWIGKTVRAEFLIGTNIMEERTGTLTDVGANYIILKELETRNHVVCDTHSLKFIAAVEDGY